MSHGGGGGGGQKSAQKMTYYLNGPVLQGVTTNWEYKNKVFVNNNGEWLSINDVKQFLIIIQPPSMSVSAF